MPFCISTGFSHRIPEAGKHFGKVSFVLESALKQKHLPEKGRKLKRPTRDCSAALVLAVPGKKKAGAMRKKAGRRKAKKNHA